jgi:hypothetical protein
MEVLSFNLCLDRVKINNRVDMPPDPVMQLVIRRLSPPIELTSALRFHQLNLVLTSLNVLAGFTRHWINAAKPFRRNQIINNIRRPLSQAQSETQAER